MNNLNDIFFAPAANQDLTYDQVLEDVQRYFAENHASTIAEAGEGNAERATTLLKELMVQYIVKRKYAIEAVSYTHLYRSQRETNFEEYLRTLYSSNDYTEMLEATVAGGLAEKIPLSTEDYEVSLSLIHI